MKISISACVIAKNEEENIGRWLESMKHVADEMIVVDTGSTDRTAAMAREAGADVYLFDWCNDFSAAKNFALEQAKGNWILFLDADEYFTPAAQAKVRPLLMRLEPNLRIEGVLCRLVNIDVDDGNRVMTTLVQLRIFRNRKNLRYEGRIHEVLTITEGRPLELANEIEIYHTGYSTHIVQAKLRRDLRLLQERIAANNGRQEPMDDRYFMDIWYGLQDYDKAILYAKKLLAHGNLPPELKGRAYETWASSCMYAQHPAAETDRCLTEAIRECPGLAEFPFMRGLCRFEQRQYLQAEEDLQAGLRLREAYAKDTVAGVMDNAVRLLPSVYWRLGELAEKQLDAQAAQEYYWQGLQQNRYHSGLFLSFFHFLQRQRIDAADIIEVLNAIYDKKADAAFLAQHLSRQNGGLVYVYYAGQAGEDKRQVLGCLAGGRPDGAAELADRQLRFLYRLLALAGDQAAETLLPAKRGKILQAAIRWRSDREKGESDDIPGEKTAISLTDQADGCAAVEQGH